MYTHPYRGLRHVGWGKQLRELTAIGWAEARPDYDDADTLVEKRIFVREQGFGVLKNAPRKKHGWGPCSVDFHEGGRTSLILRLRGKVRGNIIGHARNNM